MKKKDYVTITLENGEKKDYPVIYNVFAEETQSNYVVYTTGLTDDKKNIILYTAKIIKTDEGDKLESVNNEAELRIIDKKLNQYIEIKKYEFSKMENNEGQNE